MGRRGAATCNLHTRAAARAVKPHTCAQRTLRCPCASNRRLPAGYRLPAAYHGGGFGADAACKRGVIGPWRRAYLPPPTLVPSHNTHYYTTLRDRALVGWVPIAARLRVRCAYGVFSYYSPTAVRYCIRFFTAGRCEHVLVPRHMRRRACAHAALPFLRTHCTRAHHRFPLPCTCLPFVS